MSLRDSLLQKGHPLMRLPRSTYFESSKFLQEGYGNQFDSLDRSSRTKYSSSFVLLSKCILTSKLGNPTRDC